MFVNKMNNKLLLYVSPVPDANALNIDALNISSEGLDGCVYCPVVLIPNIIQKMNTYRCQIIVCGPRLAQVAMVLGSGKSVNQTSITTTSLASSIEITIQSEIPSESVLAGPSCLAPRHHSESLELFSEQVAERIKAPQRSSSRKLYESRWAIFELWCQQNQVVSSEPTISNIAEFLITYLLSKI